MLIDLLGLATYRSGIPSQRRSPIPILTRLKDKQLRLYDEQRYHIILTVIYLFVVANVSFCNKA